jgi:hypothetical protein
MECNVNGSGCRICPGMWLAGLLLIGMLIQSWFFSDAGSTPSAEKPSSTASGQSATK